MLVMVVFFIVFFFSSRRRHTILQGDWSSDVCSSDLRFVWSDGRRRRLWPRCNLQDSSGWIGFDQPVLVFAYQWALAPSLAGAGPRSKLLHDHSVRRPWL